MSVNIQLSSLWDLPAPIVIFFAVLGVLMVVAGRKLLWLYLGGIAFLIAYVVLSANVLPRLQLSQTAIVLIPLVTGLVVGAIMYVLRPVALVIAALALGINIATQFVRLLNIDAAGTNTLQSIIVLVVGVACVVVSFRYRDDALIVLSVLTGAGLITQDLLRMDTNAGLTAVVWLLLSLLGVIVQYAYLQREQRARHARLAASSTSTSARIAEPSNA